MSEPRAKSGAHGALARVGALVTSLTGYPPGHLGSSRGRCIRTILTAALIVTGTSAWALALVQPWAAHGNAMAMVGMAGGVDTERVRSAAVDLEKVISENAVASPSPLKRNPFGQVQVRRPEGAATHPAEGASAVAQKTQGPPSQGHATAKTVLDTAKGLKVEMILTGASGERWVVINGASYREGDAVAGLAITEIQGTRVKLQHAGITCLLGMD